MEAEPQWSTPSRGWHWLGALSALCCILLESKITAFTLVLLIRKKWVVLWFAALVTQTGRPKYFRLCFVSYIAKAIQVIEGLAFSLPGL